MSLMWMPPHTTVPPRRDGLQRERHERADGGEDDRRVERLAAGGSSEPPAHTAPSSQRERLRRVVARAGEGEHSRPC